MKRYKTLVKLILSVLLIASTSGCKWASQYDYSPYKHIFLEEEAYLGEDASSPFCDFSIDYSCLNEENDSIAMLINRAIQNEFLGEEYADLIPEAAVDSFKNIYLRNYRQEVGELYQMEKNNTAAEEIPAWYSQTYSMVSLVEEGHGGTINASANIFVDTGGAHPNQWSRWINFDFEDGKQLTKENVFLTDSYKDIERILLDKLILQQAELNPEEEVKSLEDLQKLGFLQLTNMYIPDNFLLSKKNLLFLFNRYDIAPYSAGEIVLEVPYEEIGPYLKQM